MYKETKLLILRYLYYIQHDTTYHILIVKRYLIFIIDKIEISTQFQIVSNISVIKNLLMIVDIRAILNNGYLFKRPQLHSAVKRRARGR